MNKFIKILNIIIKILFDIVVFGMFLANTVLVRYIYDIVLPEAPDWPVRIFVFLMGVLFVYVISHINRNVNIMKWI